MHIEEGRSVRRGCRGYPFPIRGGGGCCETTPSQAALADAFAACGDIGTAIQYASASPSTSKVHGCGVGQACAFLQQPSHDFFCPCDDAFIIVNKGAASSFAS
eukprot:5828233-Pleurochrysis_carterae.AAC.1